MDEAQEFNSGHLVEGLDRCHTILLLIDELLLDHPAVLKAGGAEQVAAAQEALGRLYQMVGQLDAWPGDRPPG